MKVLFLLFSHKLPARTKKINVLGTKFYFWLKQQHADKKCDQQAMTWQLLRMACFWIISEKQRRSIFDSSFSSQVTQTQDFWEKGKTCSWSFSVKFLSPPPHQQAPIPFFSGYLWASTSISGTIDGPHPYLPSPIAVPLARGCFLLGKKHIIPWEAANSVWLNFFLQTKGAAKVGACAPVSMETRCVPCLQNKQWYLFSPVWVGRQDIVYVGVHGAPRVLKR